MSGIQRILVPTDFSPASDIALQYAMDMAGHLGARIHLVHVVDDASFAIAYPDGVYVPDVPELREQLVKEATDELQKPVTRCAAAGIMTTSEVLVGTPSKAIVQAAASQGSDLIVIGTHGRGALAHFILGSVAERVVRTAQCPVLTVRDTSRIADALAAERMSAHVATQPA
jgi:nucleotide-binding universal stress UspA family protein